jgi:O-antigen ligase
MLQTAINAIDDHPLLGTGINTTTTDTSIGPMVVHNTYLQVWADLGMIGLLSYLWIVSGWIFWFPRVLSKIRTLTNIKEQALYYNAIFILCFFAISGLFHPLSTEWSEWIVYIVPYALFWEILRSKQNVRLLYA